MKYLLSISFLALLFNNCSLKSTSEEISLTKRNNEVVILVGDVFKDSLSCFKITTRNKSTMRVIDAYYNCGLLTKRIYNAGNKKLDGCNNRLVLENDTVKMWATYTIAGKKVQFDNVTLILREEDGEEISYLDTTFSFVVKERVEAH